MGTAALILALVELIPIIVLSVAVWRLRRSLIKHVKKLKRLIRVMTERFDARIEGPDPRKEAA